MSNSTESIRGKLVVLPDTTSELWARVCYDLISSNQWNAAFEAYEQFKRKNAKILPIMVDLKPMCDLDQLEKKGAAWIIDLMNYFLHCGSDFTNMSVQKNDTYFHAVVRITLVSGEGLICTVTRNKYSDKFVFATYFIQNLIFSKQRSVVSFSSILMN